MMPHSRPHAFSTAAYLIYRQPTSLLQNKTPFEALFHQITNYLKLKKLGCLCFPLTKPYNTNKLQTKAISCLFVGYSQTQNAYKCLDLSTNRLYLSRHVTFDETQTPFQILSTVRTPPPSSSWTAAPPVRVPTPSRQPPVTSDRATNSASPSGNASDLPSPILEQLQLNSPCSTPNFLHHNEGFSPSTHTDALAFSQILTSTGPSPTHAHTEVPISTQISPPMSIAPNVSQPQRTHSMVTESMNQIYKPKQFHAVTKHPIPHTIEPSCVSQALCDPH